MKLRMTFVMTIASLAIVAAACGTVAQMDGDTAKQGAAGDAAAQKGKVGESAGTGAASSAANGAVNDDKIALEDEAEQGGAAVAPSCGSDGKMPPPPPPLPKQGDDVVFDLAKGLGDKLRASVFACAGLTVQWTDHQAKLAVIHDSTLKDAEKLAALKAELEAFGTVIAANAEKVKTCHEASKENAAAKALRGLVEACFVRPAAPTPAAPTKDDMQRLPPPLPSLGNEHEHVQGQGHEQGPQGQGHRPEGGQCKEGPPPPKPLLPPKEQASYGSDACKAAQQQATDVLKPATI